MNPEELAPATSFDESSHKTVLRIAVGSQNPAKIRAVEQALQGVLAHKQRYHRAHQEKDDDDDHHHCPVVVIQATGFDVASGVRAQPMGDDETCLGAKNRAAAAYFAYRKQFGTAPHLAFGLEGGLEEIHLPKKVKNGEPAATEKHLYCMAWMAVYGKRSAATVDLIASDQVTSYNGDRAPRFGFGKTGTFPIPPQVSALVESGMELGPANDKVFRSTESRSGLGAVGLLTGGLIDRSAYYEHAIMLALTPWFRPDVYP